MVVKIVNIPHKACILKSGDKLFGVLLVGGFSYEEVLSYAKACSSFLLRN